MYEPTREAMCDPASRRTLRVVRWRLGAFGLLTEMYLRLTAGPRDGVRARDTLRGRDLSEERMPKLRWRLERDCLGGSEILAACYSSDAVAVF